MKKITKILSVTSLLLAGTGSVFAQTCADVTVPGVWDAVKGGSNPVVATTTNPLTGLCSLDVPLQAGKRYVQDDMSAETSFRGTFQIDPNSLALPTSGQQRKVKVHQVQCGAGCSTSGTVDWLQIKLRQQPAGYKLGIWAREDNENKISTSVDLADGCNTIEYELIAGNPGTFRLWVNNTVEGSPDFETTTANFSNRFTDRVRLGRSGTGTNIVVGSQFYLDTFESRRVSFIGNTCAP
jgi:hypothetical protein